MKKLIITKAIIFNSNSNFNSKLIFTFNNLTRDDIKRITTEGKINRKQALKIASVYDLEAEIRDCIDLLGMKPIEALTEWNILQ